MNKFFKKTEFKLFLTIWIVYIFFISTYGGSYIAESNIHQAMAIVDHWSFETQRDGFMPSFWEINNYKQFLGTVS